MSTIARLGDLPSALSGSFVPPHRRIALALATTLVSAPAATSAVCTFKVLESIEKASQVPGDEAGTSLAVRDGLVAVGVPEGSGVALVSGVVRLFAAGEGPWTWTAELAAADGAPLDRFGTSVALTADGTVIVGAPWHDAPGAGGPMIDAGAVYVFSPDGAAWSQVAKLVVPTGAGAPVAGARLGQAIAVDGELVAVAAPSPCFTPGCDDGRVHLFRHVDGDWIHEAALAPLDGAEGRGFGAAVAVVGDAVLVGARVTMEPSSTAVPPTSSSGSRASGCRRSRSRHRRSSRPPPTSVPRWP